MGHFFDEKTFDYENSEESKEMISMSVQAGIPVDKKIKVLYF
jgi:hypothetical protein